jgi:DTW domain-containing protein YfiP
LNLHDYQRLKQTRLAAEIPPRELCYACWRPKNFCYCGKILKASLEIHFAILIHPLEEKRPIATGRMAHLCLENSFFLEGDDFSDHSEVNALISDPKYFPVVLYPGADSMDLSVLPKADRHKIFPPGKKPLILVIDGTWNTAKRTMNKSENLKKLPWIRFTPDAPSRIRVRQQPEKHCYTTIEAIHEVINLLSPAAVDKPHENLLEVLDYMVGLQLQFAPKGKRRDEGPRIRKSSEA